MLQNPKSQANQSLCYKETEGRESQSLQICIEHQLAVHIHFLHQKLALINRASFGSFRMQCLEDLNMLLPLK